jgi:hypothetical protein
MKANSCKKLDVLDGLTHDYEQISFFVQQLPRTSLIIIIIIPISPIVRNVPGGLFESTISAMLFLSIHFHIQNYGYQQLSFAILIIGLSSRAIRTISTNSM